MTHDEFYAAAIPVAVGRNVLVYDEKAGPGEFTDRLVRVMAQVCRSLAKCDPQAGYVGPIDGRTLFAETPELRAAFDANPRNTLPPGKQRLCILADKRGRVVLGAF